MSLMTTTARRLPLPRLIPPSQLLPSKKKSQPRSPKRLPLQLKRTRTTSLRPNRLKIRVKVVMLLQPRMATVVAEVVGVVDAITNGETVVITATGEVEIVTAIGEVEIVETIVETVEDAAVTEATTAAAVAATASLTKTKTASLWKLERSPSHVTEATTEAEVTVVTVVNLEGVTVATAMETAVTEMDTAVVVVAAVADPKLLTEVTMALPAKNNSQLLAKSERRQARTDKVKCE